MSFSALTGRPNRLGNVTKLLQRQRLNPRVTGNAAFMKADDLGSLIDSLVKSLEHATCRNSGSLS